MSQVIHEVIHAFLYAEYMSPKTPWKYDHINFIIIKTCKDLDPLNTMNNPSFIDPFENQARFRALMSIRRYIWCNLPPDINWSKIQFSDIDWNFVKCIYPKTKDELSIYNEDTLDLTGIVLFKEDDLYYVVEGNHRVSGYISNRYKKIICHHIFVGESITKMKCPLIDKLTNTEVKLYAEGIDNHWSCLYEDQINPDYI